MTNANFNISLKELITQRLAQKGRDIDYFLNELSQINQKEYFLELIEDGNLPAPYFKAIQTLLGISEDDIEQAQMYSTILLLKKISENNDPKEDFQPHLWLKVERERPNQIYLLAYTGVNRWLKVELPIIMDVGKITKIIKEDYTKKEGKVPWLSKKKLLK